MTWLPGQQAVMQSRVSKGWFVCRSKPWALMAERYAQSETGRSLAQLPHVYIVDRRIAAVGRRRGSAQRTMLGTPGRRGYLIKERSAVSRHFCGSGVFARDRQMDWQVRDPGRATTVLYRHVEM